MTAADMIGLDGRLADVLESVADGVTVLDRNGVIRFANDAAAQLMGLPDAASVMGRSSTEVMDDFELLDPDGGEFDVSRIPTRRALAGEPDPEELMRFRVRGSVGDHWSLVRARLLPGASPDLDLVVTAFQDITSLKRSEDRIRFLSEASAILADSVDYQETVAKVAGIAVPRLADWCAVDVIERGDGINRLAVAHADPAKVALAEEVRRRWPPDSEHPGAVEQVLEARRSILLAEITDEQLSEGARDEEHLTHLRELGIRSALIVPLEARGEILGALSLVQAESGRVIEPEDVTLAEELGRRAGAAIDAARLVWEAKETARVRDEFIAVASHDMRTPLAAVRGYAQLARRQLAADQPDLGTVDRWLGEIDSVVGRLNLLVSELMDASLIHGGHEVPLDEQVTNLADLAKELLRARHQLSDRHRFTLDLDGSVPAGIWDPTRLARVLENLLDNAVKFSPEGGEINLRVGSDDGHAYAAVADRGIGIARSELKLIFSPTYRGRNARGTVGTGLGLAGTRRLIEQMGGSLAVESELGAGSTFTVRLPLTRSAGRPKEPNAPNGANAPRARMGASPEDPAEG